MSPSWQASKDVYDSEHVGEHQRDSYDVEHVDEFLVDAQFDYVLPHKGESVVGADENKNQVQRIEGVEQGCDSFHCKW